MPSPSSLQGLTLVEVNMQMAISDDALIQRTRELVQSERKVGVEVLKHLREIEARKLYLGRGYPNLFEMCTGEFKYSAGGAQRRIYAMRLMRDVPAAEEKIADGSLCLATASRIQSHFHPREVEVRRHSRKIGVPVEHLQESKDLKKEKADMIDRLAGKTSREVDRELAVGETERPQREVVRYISKDRLNLSFSVSEDLFNDLEKLKQLLSHKGPSMSLETLLRELSTLALRKLDLGSADQGSSKRLKSDSENSESLLPALEVDSSRFIPLKVKRRVWERDGGQCTFVDTRTGKKCGSKHLLQFDHIRPYSRGGPSTVKNLRLLCSGHNRYRHRRLDARLT